jgi:hypothetical protein
MQVAFHQVIRVIAVGHRFVAAARSVDMLLRMSVTRVVRRAGGRIGGGYREAVLVDVPGVGVVQVAFVQIVDVPLVLNRDVPTIWAVLMGVILVNAVSLHRRCSLASLLCRTSPRAAITRLVSSPR